MEIERIFDAPKEEIWKAWTDPEVLKKWWGPKDFTSPSAEIEFQEGGKYVLAMRGPEGSDFDQDMYSAGVYKEIVPNEKIVVTDYFSDKDGNKLDPKEYGMPQDMPVEMTITLLFEDAGEGKSKLTVKYPEPETEKELESMQKSGMKEGWLSSLDKLAKVVEK